MNTAYRQFFALAKEPFCADIPRKDILLTKALSALEERIHYTIRLGAIGLITGEIGSGKSTSLRYVLGGLHPSEYRIIYVIASSGSILELYRQILNELAIDLSSSSRVLMTRKIKQEVIELTQGKKMKVVLFIDEASLLRIEVLTELHTLTQFEQDSKPFLPVILAGQVNLIDNLRYRSCLSLANRVVSKTHLKGSDLETMQRYLKHHLGIAGVDRMIFDETAITAIQQGSGGLFRRANSLALGAIIAAAHSQSSTATAEHVRIAATELL